MIFGHISEHDWNKVDSRFDQIEPVE